MRQFRNGVNFPPLGGRKPLFGRREGGVKKVLAGPEVSAVSPLSSSERDIERLSKYLGTNIFLAYEAIKTRGGKGERGEKFRNEMLA
jgi:hypothetical protein